MPADACGAAQDLLMASEISFGVSQVNMAVNAEREQKDVMRRRWQEAGGRGALVMLLVHWSTWSTWFSTATTCRTSSIL